MIYIDFCFVSCNIGIEIYFESSMENVLCKLINNALSDAAKRGQSGPGSNDDESALHIPQNSRTGAPQSDCVVSYTGHLLG